MRARIWLLLGCAACAGLSLARFGFAFPRDNNVFHVPIVLGLMDLAQFADDPAMQSLHDFTAPIYRLMALVASEDNIGALFLAAHVLTRFASMVALLIAALGIAGRGAGAALCALAALDVLNGYALIGGHGLFIDYFTHSEMALPFVVAALHLMARGRTVAALATCGVLFNVNAFVAVWTGVALLGAAWRRAGGPGPVGMWNRGLALAGVLALPTLAWILRVQWGAGPHPVADYRGFLRFYFPGHFFIDAADATAMACLAGLVAIAWLALGMLGERGQSWRGALAASVALLAAGAVVPLLTGSPTILNLHLFRSAGMLHIVAMVALVALAAAAAAPGVGALRRLGVLGTLLPLAISVAEPIAVAASLAACLAISVPSGRAAQWRKVGAGFLRAMRRGGGQRILRPGMAMVLLLLLGLERTAVGAWQRSVAERQSRASREDFAAVARWAREATPVGATFMVLGRAPGVEAFMFPVLAHRRLYVDRWSGAAVLWRPSVHAEWRRRLEAQRGIATMASAQRFGCEAGIDYVLAFGPPGAAAAFAHGAVAAVPVACDGR